MKDPTFLSFGRPYGFSITAHVMQLFASECAINELSRFAVEEALKVRVEHGVSLVDEALKSLLTPIECAFKELENVNPLLQKGFASFQEELNMLTQTVNRICLEYPPDSRTPAKIRERWQRYLAAIFGNQYQPFYKLLYLATELIFAALWHKYLAWIHNKGRWGKRKRRSMINNSATAVSIAQGGFIMCRTRQGVGAPCLFTIILSKTVSLYPVYKRWKKRILICVANLMVHSKERKANHAVIVNHVPVANAAVVMGYGRLIISI
jgi:hypothetical protein